VGVGVGVGKGVGYFYGKIMTMVKGKVKVITKKPQQVSKNTVPVQSRRRREELLWLVLIFLFAFFLYLPTLNHGYVLDDNGVLVQNRFVRDGISGLPSILTHTYRFGAGIEGDNIYRPLSQVMFAVEWQFFPGKAWFSHFVNILFYAFGCTLLFIILKKYLSGLHSGVILFIVLLFASHPVHTEVVANIKSRDELMAFFFLMITLWLIWKSMSTRWMLYIFLAALTYFLALMSKEGVATMVFIFPLMMWLFTGLKGRKLIVATAIMVIPVIIYIMIRQQIVTLAKPIYTLGIIDNLMVSAPDGLTRFATAVRILGKYLFYSVIPYQQVSDYSYHQLSLAGLSDPLFILSFFFITGIILVSVFYFRKKSIIAFGVIFFLVTLSIYSNIFFLFGSAFGERFLFLPVLGICILMVMLGMTISKADVFSPELPVFVFYRLNRLPVIFIFVVILLFSLKTLLRSAEWKDARTLFTADVQQSPNSARLHMQMGTVWRDLAREESDAEKREMLVRLALGCYRRSLEILPSFPEAQEQTGLAWYMLGQREIAMFYYEMVIRKNPMKAELWNNIGSVWVDRGDLDQALKSFRKATEINPGYADGWQNTGSVLGRMGHYNEAIPCFLKSIELAPDKALSYQLLALTYQNLGMNEAAVEWQRRAMEVGMSEVGF
jgi:tetratricopeptide (TPR) repeat protein